MKQTLLLVVAAVLVASACSAADVAETSPDETPLSTTTTVASATTTKTAPTTTGADAGAVEIVTGDDADVDAVVFAYQIVFSSATGYEEKVPHLEDPEGLEETVAQYQTTGESMGGVELAPTSVTIDGDTAAVTYDLLFGGTPIYPDLRGNAVLRDGTWRITRDMFCATMASARVGCPEE